MKIMLFTTINMMYWLLTWTFANPIVWDMDNILI